MYLIVNPISQYILVSKNVLGPLHFNGISDAEWITERHTGGKTSAVNLSNYAFTDINHSGLLYN